MDDEYARAQQENMRNPKNRFLGLFCHAKDIDNSWGCGWSFSTGVIMFSIIIGIASLADIYYLAERKIFSHSDISELFKFMIIIKIASDLISFIGIGIACYAVNASNYTYSIVCYYVIVLSFLLNTIFLVYAIIAIFKYFDYIGIFILPWGILEFGLLLFCWILFANQVYVGRQRKAQVNQSGY